MPANGLKDFDLSGKCALVTGAAGLLGKEHVAALAEAGAHVVMTDLHEESLRAAYESLPEFARALASVAVMDVTKAESIAQTAARFERIDILVNNAAIDPKVTNDNRSLELSRLEHYPEDHWRLHLDVGVTGAFLCIREFGTRMAARNSGVILNIASDLSVIAPDQRLYRVEGREEHEQPVKPIAYSAVKTALLGITRYCAAYWAKAGIRVNALSPGGVFNDHNEIFTTRLSALIPMGRMAHLSEYRSAVQFLCSDASSYMTGQNIVIDGGRSIL
ncbi:NAD(P)-dependent dehydrogenase, short-chain alcohol dehydrogenase family [Rhodoblastus acidophilus]|uniref:NAD(P)-dependent dehydrogenase, short-chain alcohol dehydrogenase family n=1 Tax=Rhodoblastus acidophilus TaxID=1074 RepID=A0A212RRW6_RHOAC|nr:NAD(P)-dependent dehydrogenase, short-chain alcohol dehydrogenase family [Rhodoblastus acidophilus]